MAKRKSKRSNDLDLERDDLSSLLSPPSRPVRPDPVIVPTRTAWRSIEDLRTYHPGGPYRSARTFMARPVQVTRLRNDYTPIRSPRVVQSSVRYGRQLQTKAPVFARERLAFEMPKSVLVCARREMRREVLFAKRKTGRGAYTKKRRNQWSNVKC